jgi:hypothetical protein
MDEKETGSINNNVKVTFFTTSRCSQRRTLFQSKRQRQTRTAFHVNIPATRLAASANNNSMTSAVV